MCIKVWDEGAGSADYEEYKGGWVMSADWQNIRAEEIALDSPNAMSTGPFGSAISSKFFKADGVPVIRGGNLSTDISSRMSDERLVFVSKEKAAEFKRSLVRSGDLVFTCWGTINQVGLINDDLDYSEYVISNKQMKLTPDPKKADSLFLYYLFSSPMKQDEIISNGIGAAVPGFNLGQLKNHVINLPPIAEQKRIANILDLFDRKIRHNRQINQTLESMAQTIFKSWFVDFEPVKAKITALESGEDAEGVTRTAMRAISGKTDDELDKMEGGRAEDYAQLKTTAGLFPSAMQETELGEVPEGWEFSSIDAEFNTTMGQSPPGNTYNENGDGAPFFQGRRDFGWRYPEDRVYCTQPKRMAKKGDTLLSVRAPVGDINKAISDCCIGRGIASLRHKSGCEAYTYYTMMDLSRKFNSFDSEGTVFGSINQKDLKALKIIKPSNSLIEVFTHIAGTLDQQILNSDDQIRVLSKLRDTLLPKLLLGELSVDAIETPKSSLRI